MKTYQVKIYRISIRLALLTIVFTFNNFNIIAQEKKLSNHKELMLNKDNLSKPRWSPDDSKILFTSDHNKGLFIYDLKSDSIKCITKEAKSGFKAHWLNNYTVAYEVKGKQNTISLNSNKSSEIKGAQAYINLKNFTINIYDYNTHTTQQISEKGEMHYYPILSPDKKWVVTHMRSEMILINTEDPQTKISIGTGLANAWSSDSKSVYYFKDVSSDGHQIENSELYYYNLYTQESYKLTNTADKIEMWPDISADGSQIVYIDERSGKIYTADIN